ncbi:hypothetical protein H2203_002169 [Taxawa tesnikishii (nom. ined.)]|nr:hypothetical protein H2203_002169 [Dothideales sp. JES 119]
MRPLAGLKTAVRQLRADKQVQVQVQRRLYATAQTGNTVPVADFHPGSIMRGNNKPSNMKKIKIFPSPKAARTICPDPVAAVTSSQLALLDPTGARTRLFDKANIERAQVGDILLVRMKNGDPFAGVCLNVRRSGIDTAVLLRNQLTRVGVEMWYKIYSPNVEGIEVVQRKEKRAKRARLYYMRQPKHDVGSVENIVRQYQRQRAMLRSSEVKSRDANSAKKKNNKKGRN